MANPIDDVRRKADSSKVEALPAYDCEAGVPTAMAGKSEPRDPNAYPVNPPAKKAPAKNLKRPG